MRIEDSPRELGAGGVESLGKGEIQISKARAAGSGAPWGAGPEAEVSKGSWADSAGRLPKMR